MCITTTENSKVGGGGILFNCTEFLQKCIDFFLMHGYGGGGGGGDMPRSLDMSSGLLQHSLFFQPAPTPQATQPLPTTDNDWNTCVKMQDVCSSVV